MIEIDTSNYNFNSGLFLVKFHATWCSPCKKMEPLLHKLEEEFTGIKFISVDIDQLPSFSKRFLVKSLPTILFLKDGVEINRVVGVSLIEPIRKILRELLE